MTERPDSGRPRRDGASSRPQRPGAPKRDGFKPRAGRDEAASKPRGARSGGRPMRNGEATDERPAWQTRVAGAIRSDKPKSPPIPEEITAGDLEMPIRVQLKTLSAENAEMVARHLAVSYTHLRAHET